MGELIAVDFRTRRQTAAMPARPETADERMERIVREVAAYWNGTGHLETRAQQINGQRALQREEALLARLDAAVARMEGRVANEIIKGRPA